MVNEIENLNIISKENGYSTGVNSNMVAYTFEIVRRFITGDSVLEMGPAEGVMTELLVKAKKNVTVVEGAEVFCKSISSRFPTVEVNNCLFEEYTPKKLFDGIILGHVLEHVLDPVELINRAKQWLIPETGRIFAAVPNSRSLHRQAAVIMGLLSEESTLNKADIQHGHRRVFNPESFRNVFLNAGMNIEFFGGYWLKPVSNKQLEDHWTPSMLHAFMKLGERYPDIAAEIYVIAKI